MTTINPFKVQGFKVPSDLRQKHNNLLIDQRVSDRKIRIPTLNVELLNLERSVILISQFLVDQIVQRLAGRLRPIAALTEKRLTVLPQVPTIKEQGIDVPIIANARGIIAPPGVAKEVITFWEDFFARLTQTASWKKYVADNQVEDVFIKSADLGPFFDEQTKLMRSVLQQAGVKLAR